MILPLLAALGATAPNPAHAQPRPFVVMVRGHQPTNDTAFEPLGMQPVRDYLATLNAEVWSTTWNCFRHGAAQAECPLSDAQFLQDLGSYVNALPPERPVILIGHSFGADSLLKVVTGASGISPRISRRITALITIDPVGWGGQRLTAQGYYSPGLGWATLFFNRWQRNAPWPVNYLDDGYIPGCYAERCSQAEHPYQRNWDGSIIQDVHYPPVLECPVGWPCPPPPPPVYTNRLSDHGSLVNDAYLNRQIVDELRAIFSRDRAGEYSWSQGNAATYMGTSADKVCYLTRMVGRFEGYGEAVHAYTSGSSWYLGGSSNQTYVGASARCTSVPSISSYTGEYSWHQSNSAPTYLGPATGRVCFLTHVSGKFKGWGEKVHVYINNGSWYLGGASMQQDVSARARCVNVSSYTGEYSWQQSQPAATYLGSGTNRSCALTYVQGSFMGWGEYVHIFKSFGNWYLGGASAQNDVAAKARCFQ